MSFVQLIEDGRVRAQVAEEVGETLYERIPSLWRTQEDDRGKTMTPWYRLGKESHHRLTALRHADAVLKKIERELK